jgi:hypothetical protein
MMIKARKIAIAIAIVGPLSLVVAGESFAGPMNTLGVKAAVPAGQPRCGIVRIIPTLTPPIPIGATPPIPIGVTRATPGAIPGITVTPTFGDATRTTAAAHLEPPRFHGSSLSDLPCGMPTWTRASK